MEPVAPLVSIISPSYNQDSFIEDMILSVKNQSYKNIEHIIIDGGSSDNTLEIIKKYEKTYNLSWISEADKGQADAIGKGFDRINGTIVTWLNTDDYYLDETAVEKVVKYFKEHDAIDIVTGRGYWVDEKKSIISAIVKNKKLITLKYMRYADFILQPATFFRRSVIDSIKIEKQYSYVFDWLFFLTLFEKNFSFLVVDDFFSAYRIYKNNKTGQDNANRKEEIYEVALRNFGRLSFQTKYCYSIYRLYVIAEKLPKPLEKLFKYLINKINYGIKILTDYRLCSGWERLK